MNIEEDKYTFKTDFGLGGKETEITMYRCLYGNELAKKVFESLVKADEDMLMLMMDVHEKQPEYYAKVLKVKQDMMTLRHDLDMQIKGYIRY